MSTDDNTPLVGFIFILYVSFMCLVRDVIHPLQHLIVVLITIIVMVVLTYWGSFIATKVVILDQLVFHPNAVTSMELVVETIKCDYKRSNFRRLVKRVKRSINYFLK